MPAHNVDRNHRENDPEDHTAEDERQNEVSRPIDVDGDPGLENYHNLQKLASSQKYQVCAVETTDIPVLMWEHPHPNLAMWCRVTTVA